MKRKIFLVTIHETNGRTRKNPLMSNEIHLVKTMLNHPDTAKVEIETRLIEASNQIELDNKICMLFH